MKPILQGLPASSGIVTGRICLVSSINDLEKIKQGDILVAEKTTPDFTIIFGKLIGIITDEGGMTSHAAIISRELGIPAIVGTKTATKNLIDGDLVTIDGNTGEIYKGRITLHNTKRQEYPTFPLKYTGNDIDDFLTAVTLSVNDATELWPLRPGQLIPYIDMYQSLDLFQKLTLLKKDHKFSESTKLLSHPTTLRMYLINSGITGMKAATMLGKAKKEDQIAFFYLLADVLKQLEPSDPWCLDGTNRVLSTKKVDDITSRDLMMDLQPAMRKPLNLLLVTLQAYIWACYWDYFFDGGCESYGPYTIKKLDNQKLIIYDFFDLKPTEIWPVTNNVPFQKITLAEVYDVGQIYFRIGNRIHNSDDLRDKNTYGIVLVDGKAVTTISEIENLTRLFEELTKQQTAYVNHLSDVDKVRKGAMLSYYPWKNVYSYFGLHWYPEEIVEKSLAILGREFLEKSSGENNKSLEEKRKFFDPRNDYL